MVTTDQTNKNLNSVQIDHGIVWFTLLLGLVIAIYPQTQKLITKRNSAKASNLEGINMEMIFQEIDKALNAELYYLAIAMALTVPDICAALESPNGETSGPKYKAWYNGNLANQYPRITDADCWSLRCGVLHQGRCGHPNMQYGRILFTLPNPQNNIFHNNVINDALNLDAKIFCCDVVTCARLWFAGKRNDPVVQKNLPNLVQMRPQGLAPYMVGMPLIA
jgi:hypothetical protein